MSLRDRAVGLKEKISKKTKTVLAVSLISLGLYLLGLEFVLFPAGVVLAYLYLPLPTIFQSKFSRAFVSVLLSFALLPVAGALQFLFLSWTAQSDFTHTAIIYALLLAAVCLFAPAREKLSKQPLFTSIDVFGLIVGLLFMLPFASIFMGADTFARILQIAGFQVVDAGHHFSFINHYGYTQFLNLGFYPAGFHFSVAFLQEAIFGQLYDAGWRVNALLYFSHYMLLGVALGYAAYYLCVSIFESLKTKIAAVRPRTRNLILAMCLGPSLVLFYVLPLFAQGFLNYFYVIVVLLLGFVFLIDGRSTTDVRYRRWGIFAYLLLAYSAVSSWSLMIPLVLLIGLFFFLPGNLTWRNILKEIKAPANLPALAIVGLQLVLVYFQATTVQLGSAEGFNATGNLTQLHYLVLILGFALTLAVILSKKADESVRKIMYGIFVPAFFFVVCMSLVQYFQTGEIRYFAVKISIFVEILSLILAVAVLVRAYLGSEQKLDVRLLVLLPLVPIIGMTFLLSTVRSPLNEVREIFKPYSGIDKPQYYDHDARKFAELGSKGEMKHFNAISLHYIKEIPKLDGYMQLSYRANLFRQGKATNAISSVYGEKSGKQVLKLRECNDKVYALIEYGTASPKEQKSIVKLLKTCAKLAKDQGLTYYIVTDAISAPHIRSVFGDAVKVVY